MRPVIHIGTRFAERSMYRSLGKTVWQYNWLANVLNQVSRVMTNDLHMHQMRKHLGYRKPDQWILWGIVRGLCYKLRQSKATEPRIPWLFQKGDWSLFKCPMQLLALVQQGAYGMKWNSSNLIAIPSKGHIRLKSLQYSIPRLNVLSCNFQFRPDGGY